eukprot:1194394-Prorocentrum_minimum.AAC.2
MPGASSRCVVQYVRGTKVQNASCQRCEHPELPGASSACNVLVPWTNPSPGVGGGSRGEVSVKCS